MRVPASLEDPLRDEHGFTGGYTIVKDYVRARRHGRWRLSSPCTILWAMPRGFGEAVVEVGGQREKVAFFCLILPIRTSGS